MLRHLHRFSLSTLYRRQPHKLPIIDCQQCRFAFSTTTKLVKPATADSKDLSGKQVMSLARNGKLLESMEVFDAIKAQNTKIGLQPALRLINVLIEQSESSILSISNEANVPLEFGFNVYRLIIDDDRVKPTEQLYSTMLDLLSRYEYPTEQLYTLWTDIKRNNDKPENVELDINLQILTVILQQFVTKQELNYAMEILKWINANYKTQGFAKQLEDALYLNVLKQCSEKQEHKFSGYIYEECLSKKDQSAESIASLQQHLCYCLEAYFKDKEYDKCKQIWSSLMENVSEKKEIDPLGWNIMVQLYAQKQEREEYQTLMYHWQDMKDADIEPTKQTFLAMIQVCTNIVHLDKGKSVHLDMVRVQNKLKFGPNSKLLQDIEVQNALLQMYGKCGDVVNTSKHWNDLKKADQEHYEITKERLINIQHWNCIINVHAIAGNTEQVIELYEELKADKDIEANDVTYTMIVDVLNRKGMQEKAAEILKDQGTDTDVIECNSLSRSGQFDEAEKMIQVSSENVKSSNIMWMTLLSACRRYNDIDRAKRIYQHIVEVNGGDESAEYCQSAKLLLANIYGSIKQPEKEQQIRLELSRNNRGFKKVPGMSFIEIDGKQHKFFAHYKGHEKNKEIWAEVRRLTEIMKNEYGYVPNPRWVTRQLKSHESVESYLMGHSERLCFAFANISTPPGTKLIIGKNLRFCGDCHEVFKYFSLITDRLILCRDAKRFHHFENGKCSCNDFW